ncbi:MAG: hypothetical protein KGJ77_00975 [Acidobacteriota bacterium]|nr:hypothetical protein [Acidobacteriota bacterium]
MAESIEPRRAGGLSTVDKLLVTAGVVGGIFVVLWVARAVVGLFLLVCKIAILVVVILAVVRLLHLFSRRGR